jgi:hypothetical protein
VVVDEITVTDGLRNSKSEIPEDVMSGCQNVLELKLVCDLIYTVKCRTFGSN